MGKKALIDDYFWQFMYISLKAAERSTKTDQIQDNILGFGPSDC